MSEVETQVHTGMRKALIDAFDQARSTELGGQIFDRGEKLANFVDTRRGGIAVNILTGTASGITAYIMGSSAAHAAEVAIGQAMPFGDTAVKTWNGDGKGAVHSFMTNTASLGGTALGTMGGAALGTVLIPIPVVGTAIGGFIGGLAGGFLGNLAADETLKANPVVVDGAKSCVDIGTSFAQSAANTLYNCMSSFVRSDVFTSGMSMDGMNLVTQPFYQAHTYGR